MMEKQLVKSGKDWILEIPDNILKKMKINPETDEVYLWIENKTLYIKKYL